MKPSQRISTMSNYYFADKLAEVRRMVEAGKDIINLGIGNPDLSPPPTVIKRLHSTSLENRAGSYQPYRGIPTLREAFAMWYSRIYNVHLKDTEILPLMGSKEAIMHIHLAFCNPGDSILLPNPGYPAYAASAKILGLKTLAYNLTEANHWLPSLEELEDMDLDSCKVMWINYPHMPTGKVAKRSELKFIIDFAKKHNILLVNDNPYSLIRNEDPISIHEFGDSYHDLLELNSLSKSHHMPGWRVGVVTGHAENIRHILKVKSNFDSGMYKPIQEAAIAALSVESEWYKSINAEYIQRAKIIKQILDELNCTYNETHKGMFVWGRISNPELNGQALADRLLYEYGIFAAPGIVFGSNGNQYIRFSLCVPQERLKQALVRIQNKEL